MFDCCQIYKNPNQTVMKKIIIRSGILSITLLFVAIKTFSQNIEEIKSRIEKINEEMAQLMVGDDNEKLLSYYADDAISMPNNGEMLEGITAIRKSNQEMMSSGMKVMSFKANTIKVIPCNKYYTEIGKYQISIEVPGMQEPVNDHGKYLTIWEPQKDGSLKIKVEIWNTNINPMQHAAQ